MTSIRRRLLISLVAIMTLVLALAAWAGYSVSRHQMDELFDAEMTTAVRLLRGILDRALVNYSTELKPIVLETWLGQHEESASGELFESEDEATRYGHKYEKKIAFQIWSRDGHLLAYSTNAPKERLAPLEPGYSNRALGHHHWRVFTLQVESRWYQVAERDDVRSELGRQIGMQALMPLVLGVPLLLWLVSAVIRRGLLPLNRLADDLTQRSAQNLEPLNLSGLPEELVAIVRAQNALFVRLNSAYEREKRFAADAAHEMRTPLAALSVHAQNALRASNENERLESLTKMQVGLRRTTHVVDQLLALSRVEPTAVTGEWTVIDLKRLTGDLVRELEPMAHGKQQLLSWHAPDALPVVRGNPILLRLMLRNLVDNAIRYTPVGGQASINLEHADGIVTVRVRDTGPGIPAELRERVFERFFRAAGQAIEGSGLGLSITKRIAELHHAELDLESPPEGGLVVIVRLPLDTTGPSAEAN